MTLDHRPYKGDDAELICGFPRSAEELYLVFPKAAYPLNSKRWQEIAHARRDATVGLLDGRLAGYVDFVDVRENHYCTVGGLVVHPGYRRQGVAGYLVNAMLQTAFDRYAARFVRASCLSHNKPAFALFHKIGFRPAQMGQRLGPDGEPFLLIHLHLLARNWKRP